MSHSAINVGIEVAKSLGLSTERLCCFTIKFEPRQLVSVEAEYLVTDAEMLQGLLTHTVNFELKAKP